MNVEQLTQLILAEWSDAHSDDGSIWKATKKKLDAALAEVSPEVKDQAYAAARAYHEELWRAYNAGR